MEKRENKEVQPSTRRRLQGIVVSNKMQKTIVVETENYIKYPVYKKRVSIRKKYKVDDKKDAKSGTMTEPPIRISFNIKIISIIGNRNMSKITPSLILLLIIRLK